jgi:hypothetical protein
MIQRSICRVGHGLGAMLSLAPCTADSPLAKRGYQGFLETFSE